MTKILQQALPYLAIFLLLSLHLRRLRNGGAYALVGVGGALLAFIAWRWRTSVCRGPIKIWYLADRLLAMWRLITLRRRTRRSWEH